MSAFAKRKSVKSIKGYKMNAPLKKYYLFNYCFLIGLIILTCNDHFWKYQYHNWLTGKISDFAGLLILPLFLAYLFPRKAKYMAVLSGLFFIFWKSPLSENLIYFYNQFAFLPISRIVDYTDLIALSVLPFSHWLIINMKGLETIQFRKVKFPPAILGLVTCLIFMATSRSYTYYYQFSTGNVKLKEKYLVDASTQAILDHFKQEDIIVVRDSLVLKEYGLIEQRLNSIDTTIPPYYRIETLILEKDTIWNIQFSILSSSETTSELYLNGFQLAPHLKKKAVKKKLKKYYWVLLEDYLVKEIY